MSSGSSVKVSIVVALMLFHDVGKDIAVLWLGKRLNRLKLWERLEAELGQKTEIEFPVLRKRLIAMPYIPIVYIAAFRILWLVQAPAR